MNHTVLLIDDDVALCEILQLTLTKLGFTVEVAYEAVSGLQKAYAIRPDAVILDVMMPNMDGWQACRRFREMTDVPIIMLTAMGTQENVIKGLNLGADDYIVKPVASEELAARIHAVIRRANRNQTQPVTKEPLLKEGGLVIDFDKYEVTIDGERIDLSPTEFRLLSVLARHKGRVLPHEFLLTEVWGSEYVGEIDYLRLYISYLRRKFKHKADLIHNEWGVGYRFS